MADNYLENKMEEYKRGVRSKAAPRLVTGMREGHLDLPVAKRCVVFIGFGQAAVETARLFVKLGMRVAMMVAGDLTEAQAAFGGSVRICQVADYSCASITAVMSERLRDWKCLHLAVDAACVGVDVCARCLLDVRAAYPVPLTGPAEVISLCGDVCSCQDVRSMAVNANGAPPGQIAGLCAVFCSSCGDALTAIYSR